MRRRVILLVGLLGACFGTGGAVLADRVIPTSPLARGVYIGDRCVPSRGSAAAWLDARRIAAKERIIRFRYGDHLFESTLGEVGVEIDVEATLAAAARVGHVGSIADRIGEAALARRGGVDVPLKWKIDEALATARLSGFADELRSSPVNARVDLVNHEKIPEAPGHELDIAASIHEIELGTHEDEETVDLITYAIPAKVSLQDLVRVDVAKTLSAHETTFVTWGVGVGRSANIRNAAAKLDGIVLAPNEVFSFNDRVGARTLENGFTWAPEILGDEMTTGVGGGTCQVSTTLHIAALFGALQILERQGHSHPSAYAMMGLDATVSYPATDLKFRNPLPFPVMIHAYLPKPTVIRVELLGGDPVAKVSYRFGVANTEDFTRRIYVKDSLKPGTLIRHQKGSRGYDVTSTVTLSYFDGRVEERSYFSGYRPAPEVLWIAPGYDEGALPPMPEHAKGVELGRPTQSAKMSSRAADPGAYPM